MMGSPINSMCPNCNRSTKDPVLMRPVPCGCNFREEVLRTSSQVDAKDRLILGALGLAGEAGEVVDMIKKIQFHSKPLNRDDLIKELGDVRWYMEQVMMVIDVTMPEIERVNIAKLRKRYPNGFSAEAANAPRNET